MRNKNFFKDRNVIITGASSGIGAALAGEFSRFECKNIILIARRKEKLETLVKDIGKDNVRFYNCDVSNKKETDELYCAINSEFGVIDVAFLNAGIGDSSLAQNINSSQIENIFKTNFFGVVYWMENLLRDMQKRNSGTIVVTSSLAAYRGLPTNGPYAASKAAISTLLESYQIDLLATKIRLILVSPYFVITEMSGNRQEDNSLIWTTAQSAAQRIISGVESGKMHIIFPWHFHLFMYLMRVIPLAFYRLFWRFIRRGDNLCIGDRDKMR